jgi:hypothetical protein
MLRGNQFPIQLPVLNIMLVPQDMEDDSTIQTYVRRQFLSEAKFPALIRWFMVLPANIYNSCY